MTTQAIVTRCKTVVKVSGVYEMVVEAWTIIDNNGLSYVNDVMVTSSSFNPLLPSWKSKVRDAVIADSLSRYGLTVDQVLFPDFSILGL